MPIGRPLLLRLALAASLALSAACVSNYTDKRELQYLNQEGFGNRYTGNAEEQNYITIGDTILMDDAYHAELQQSQVVDIDGTIVLPEVGTVYVAGQTRTELEAFLMQKYSPYYTQLDIKVRLQTRGKVYFVFGEVLSEGAKQFPGDLTIFEAVMSAVPDKRTANLGRVKLIRADPRDPLIIDVDISDMFDTGNSTFNVHVQERDIVYVPPTMIAALGYFISDLLFPVTQVIYAIGGPMFYGYRNGNNGNNNGFFAIF